MNFARRWPFKIVVVCSAFAAALSASTAGFATSALATIDTDRDGTIDLAEAKAAASILFDKLDKDKDGTLDIDELEGHAIKEQLAAADRDSDKTLSKDEYLALVEATFKATDLDGEGTVDSRELKSASGRALLFLMI